MGNRKKKKLMLYSRFMLMLILIGQPIKKKELVDKKVSFTASEV
jgi:hypothetical protein